MNHQHSLRTPCSNCPFRSDIRPYLRAVRAREIAHGTELHELFCHKTTAADDDGENQIVPGRSKVCAGMMICLEHVNRPTQMMRISERLGCYDRSKLDMEAPVYPSPAAFIAAHVQVVLFDEEEARGRERVATAKRKR